MGLFRGYRNQLGLKAIVKGSNMHLCIPNLCSTRMGPSLRNQSEELFSILRLRLLTHFWDSYQNQPEFRLLLVNQNQPELWLLLVTRAPTVPFVNNGPFNHGCLKGSLSQTESNEAQWFSQVVNEEPRCEPAKQLKQRTLGRIGVVCLAVRWA